MSVKVSICVPTRNRSESLRETIFAMLAQSFQDWELIVGDDASTDNTAEVVASFSEPRIRYIRHPKNLGIYRNWNSLIGLCRGEYVAIYHDHDVYLPTILERSCDLLDRFPTMSFVHTAIILLDSEHRPLSLVSHAFENRVSGRAFQRLQIRRSFVTAATAMVRKRAYDLIGYYDPSYGLPADAEMWLRLSESGDVGYIREPQALIMARPPSDAAMAAAEEINGYRRIAREWTSRIHESVRPSSLAANIQLQDDIFRAILRAALYVSPTQFTSLVNSLAEHARFPISTLLYWARWSEGIRRLLRLAAGKLAGSLLPDRQRLAEAYCRVHELKVGSGLHSMH